MEFLDQVIERFFVLVNAPLTDQQLLWTAAPLVIATLFMTLYFGKYSKEELGWNTAFGNTMVFLFVSMNIIHYIYYSDGVGSWDNVLSNSFYLSITLVLAGVAFMLMLITYYHLLPKKAAFFLFSAPPVNVSVYIIMTIIYKSVPADDVTLAAAVILFAIIFVILKLIQMLEHMASKPEGLSLSSEEKKEDLEAKYLRQLKEKNKKILEGKKLIEKEMSKKEAQVQDEKPR